MLVIGLRHHSLLTVYSVKPKVTWALLKPNYQALLETFIFPQLVFNATKQASWEEDPLEYVRVTMHKLWYPD